MAARFGKSFKKIIWLLVLLAVVILIAVVLWSPKPSSKTTSGTPTAKPTASQSAAPVVPAGASSGPVGRNMLRAYAGPGVGEVTLEWQRYFLDGENFNLHYGTASGSYPWAINSIGYISTYTIKGLTPGTRYYFIVEGIRTGSVSAGHDGEVSVVAPGSPVEVVINGPVGRNSMIAKTGSKVGTVDLSWKRFFNDTQLYNIVYGEKPGQFIYGVLNAIDTTPKDPGNYTYTIGGLVSGKRYYFALVPQRNGQGIYVSTEISAVAR